MTRAQGARSQMALAFESVYGIPPVSGFYLVPFVSSDLGSEQPLLANEVLGFGSDPLKPDRDAKDTDGTVVVPLDVENFGFWLKGAFGQPNSTGTVAAAGAITFAGQPAADSTVTINAVVFTFKASGASGNQCNIAGSLTATLAALVTVLNASVVAGVALATYSSDATHLTVAFDAMGGAGNLFALAASAGSQGTVSGAHLTGGVSTHVFTSGADDLLSLSIESQIPEVPQFAMVMGGKVDSIGWEMRRKGHLQATIKLVCQDEDIDTTTNAGSPAELDYKRFSQFHGLVERNGATLANVSQARFAYMNNLDTIDGIRGDGLIEGADPTIRALTVQLTSRFASRALLDQAANGESCSIDLTLEISATEKMAVAIPAMYLPLTRTPITGPKGLEVTFDAQGAQTDDGGAMCVITLTNHLGTY